MKEILTYTLTQTEILARAIRQIDAELDGWSKLCGGTENEGYRVSTDELRAKRSMLCEMYKYQTGTSYD